eukprot:5742459-Pleurochrysis_carterae.AAC.1
MRANLPAETPKWPWCRFPKSLEILKGTQKCQWLQLSLAKRFSNDHTLPPDGAAHACVAGARPSLSRLG